MSAVPSNNNNSRIKKRLKRKRTTSTTSVTTSSIALVFGLVAFLSTFSLVRHFHQVGQLQRQPQALLQPPPAHSREDQATRPYKWNLSLRAHFLSLSSNASSNGGQASGTLLQKQSPQQPRGQPSRNKDTTMSQYNVNSSSISSTIVVPIGHKHFFWRGRQNRLVNLIRNVTNTTWTANTSASANANTATPHYDNNHANTTTIVLNCTIRCQVLNDKLRLGNGNLVLAYYAMRLAAAAGGVDFFLHCIQDVDSENEDDLHNGTSRQRKGQHILSHLPSYSEAPWRTVMNSNSSKEPFSPFSPPLPSLQETARGMGHNPLHYMVKAIRHDFRNMAVRLLNKEHRHNINSPGAAAAGEAASLPQSISSIARGRTLFFTSETNDKSAPVVDDVAIHFRCGDLVKGFNSKNYGMLRFETYRQYISPEAQTIGIVTSSFQEKSVRRQDKGTTDICKVLVQGLVDYLRHAFPHATVSVRNKGPDESIARAMARLVLANQTFCTPSTFCIFPTIASFGKSYIQESNLTYFVKPIATLYPDDVILIQSPMLTAIDVAVLGFYEKDDVRKCLRMLQWLVEPFCSFQLGNNNETTTTTNATKHDVRQLLTCDENTTTA